jgi:putative phosphoribosyl transferase
MNDRTFADRAAAGRELGERLQDLGLDQPIVAGISRGGMVVAAEVARVLDAPLDVVAVRKCYGPAEVAIGAVAEHEIRVENATLVAAAGLTRSEIRAMVAERLRDLAAAEAAYRGVAPALGMAGRTVVLVDAGMTTTATATAAARAAFVRGAEHTVLAVPVSSSECVEAISHQVDRVVCLRTPALLLGVAEWYVSFPPVSDGDVVEILRRVRSAEQPTGQGSSDPIISAATAG